MVGGQKSARTWCGRDRGNDPVLQRPSYAPRGLNNGGFRSDEETCEQKRATSDQRKKTGRGGTKVKGKGKSIQLKGRGEGGRKRTRLKKD